MGLAGLAATVAAELTERRRPSPANLTPMGFGSLRMSVEITLVSAAQRWGSGYPLTTPQGRSIATSLPMPAPCTTLTTLRTSL
jgi:hypothetical protein